MNGSFNYQDIDVGEYAKGNQLRMRFKPNEFEKDHPMPIPPGEGEESIQFEIVRALSPFIHTVPCVVRQVTASPSATTASDAQACMQVPSGCLCFIKFYDRRHFNRDRFAQGWLGDPWNEQKERLYQQYLASGGPTGIDFEDGLTWSKPFYKALDRKCEEIAESLNDGTRASDVELDGLQSAEVAQHFIGLGEANIAYQAERRYKSEVEACRYIHSMSPRDAPIPRFIGTIEYISPIGLVKGVVLEYVPNSIDIARYLSVAGSCGDLVGTVRNVCRQGSAMWLKTITEHPILFKRPSACNISVQLNGDVEGFFPGQQTEFETATTEAMEAVRDYRPTRLYIIGLSDTRFRYSDETDNEWAYAKCDACEMSMVDGQLRTWICYAILDDDGCKLHGETCRTEMQKRLEVWVYKPLHPWVPQWSDLEEEVVAGDWYLGFYEYRQERIAAVKQLAEEDEESTP